LHKIVRPYAAQKLTRRKRKSNNVAGTFKDFKDVTASYNTDKSKVKSTLLKSENVMEPFRSLSLNEVTFPSQPNTTRKANNNQSINFCQKVPCPELSYFAKRNFILPILKKSSLFRNRGVGAVYQRSEIVLPPISQLYSKCKIAM
jgi:hypothetical protein